MEPPPLRARLVQEDTTLANSLGPNQNLIGVDGGRWRLNTPALVLDLDTLEKNIQAMAAHCQGTGQQLRPHGKSHKCVTLARRQIEAGAVGICCATLREAEAMVGAGLPGVLITSPATTAAKISRLMALHEATEELMVVCDSAVNVDDLAAAAAATGIPRPLKVLVDFDVGLHRTGAASDEDVAALARRIGEADSLSFAGVQAYAGHLQHVEDYQARAAAMTEQAGRVSEAVDRLNQLGLKPGLLTGGGTGTHDIDHRDGVLGELQAGSYLFTDVQYNAVNLRQDSTTPFAPSLFVHGAVINNNHADHAIIDAGLKSFATDGPLPEFAAGAPPGATYQFYGDEHGAVVFAKPGESLAVGHQVACVIPHCDPTVNLYDVYHCVRGDTLVEIWPIDARGNP